VALERPGPVAVSRTGPDPIEANQVFLDMMVRELRQDQDRPSSRTDAGEHKLNREGQAKPASTARPRGKGGRPLSPETDQLIADMIGAGRPYSEIAPKAGVSIGAITCSNLHLSAARPDFIGRFRPTFGEIIAHGKPELHETEPTLP
jgi:hypothetical protein